MSDWTDAEDELAKELYFRESEMNIVELAKSVGGTEMPPFDYGARSDRLIMRHDALELFAKAIRAEALEEAEEIAKTIGGSFAEEFLAAIRRLK